MKTITLVLFVISVFLLSFELQYVYPKSFAQYGENLLRYNSKAAIFENKSEDYFN